MDPSSRTRAWPPSILILRGLWHMYYWFWALMEVCALASALLVDWLNMLVGLPWSRFEAGAPGEMWWWQLAADATLLGWQRQLAASHRRAWTSSTLHLPCFIHTATTHLHSHARPWRLCRCQWRSLVCCHDLPGDVEHHAVISGLCITQVGGGRAAECCDFWTYSCKFLMEHIIGPLSFNFAL